MNFEGPREEYKADGDLADSSQNRVDDTQANIISEDPQAISTIHQQDSIVKGLSEEYRKNIGQASLENATLEETVYAEALRAYMETDRYPVSRDQVITRITTTLQDNPLFSVLSEEQKSNITNAAWLKLCERLRGIAEVE